MTHSIRPLVDPTLEEMAAYKDEARVRQEALRMVAEVDATMKKLKSMDQTGQDRSDQVGTVVHLRREAGCASELKFDPATGAALSAEGAMLNGFAGDFTMRFERNGDLLQYQTTYHASYSSWADNTPCEHVRNVTLDLKNGTLTTETATHRWGNSGFREVKPFVVAGQLAPAPDAPAETGVTKWTQAFPVVQGNVGSAQELNQRQSELSRQRAAQGSQQRVGELIGRMQKMERSRDNLSAGQPGRVTVMESTGGTGFLGRLFGEAQPMSGELTYDPASKAVLGFRGKLEQSLFREQIEFQRKGEVECYREGETEYQINRAQGTLSLVEYPRKV